MDQIADGSIDDVTVVVVVGASAAGSSAAAAIDADLVTDDTRRAVTRRHDPFSLAAEAANCTTVLGDRRHGFDTLLAR